VKPEEPAGEEVAGAIEGLLACIDTGLAHLTPEERRDWDSAREANLLLPDAETTQEP
jgi:hypothetical protein